MVAFRLMLRPLRKPMRFSSAHPIPTLSALAVAAALFAGCDGDPAAGGDPGGAADDGGVSAPAPATCASLGAECGRLEADTPLDCGTCAAGLTCGGGGVPNRCDPGACTPGACTGLCGQLPDGCGGILSCPDCSSGDTCGARGPNVCGVGTCTPLACTVGADEAARCGQLADGCGGLVQCGTCPGGQTCRAGRCESACPAGCPQGYRCERGACRGGNQNALVLRPTLVDITATITVGGAPPSAARCEGAGPSAIKARVFFETSRGIPVARAEATCATGDYVVTLSLASGRYTTRVVLPALGGQPERTYFGAPVDVSATSSITLDVPSAWLTVRGTVVNGTVVNGDTVAAWCDPSALSESGLTFESAKTTARAELRCDGTTLSFSADLLAATYDVELDLPSLGVIALPPLTVDAAQDGLVLDTALTRVTGSMAADAACGPSFNVGRTDTPTPVQAAVDCAARTFAVDLPPGRWVFNFPPLLSGYQPSRVIEIGGAAQVVDMPEPNQLDFGGTVTWDGVALNCSQRPADSTMELLRPSSLGGVGGLIRVNVSCEGRFSTMLAAGRYVANHRLPPRGPSTGGDRWTVVDVSAARSDAVLDMKLVTFSAALRFRGGAEAAACDFGSSAIAVDFEPPVGAQGRRTFAVIPCRQPNQTFRLNLVAGTYRVVVELGRKKVVAAEALNVSAEMSNFELEIPLDFAPVGGSVDLRSLSQPRPCEAGEGLQVRFIGQEAGSGTQGRWFSRIPFSCPTTDLTFQTFLPPGLYSAQLVSTRPGRNKLLLRQPELEIR